MRVKIEECINDPICLDELWIMVKKASNQYLKNSIFDPEELLSDVYIKLHVKKDLEFNSNEEAKNWVIKVIRNAAYDMQRLKNKFKRSDNIFEKYFFGEDIHDIIHIDFHSVIEIVTLLIESKKLKLTHTELRIWDQFSKIKQLNQIRESLNLSDGTFRVHLCNLRRKINENKVTIQCALDYLNK